MGEKRTFGRVDGEIVLDGQLAPEDAALVRRAHGPFDLRLDVGKVGLINYHFHAYLHRSRPTIGTLLDALLHLLGNTHTHLVIHFCYSIIITQLTPASIGLNYGNTQSGSEMMYYGDQYRRCWNTACCGWLWLKLPW